MSFGRKTRQSTLSLREAHREKVIDVSPENYSITLYPGGTVLDTAAQLAEQDRCRALLAANALRNTLALSMAENQAIICAPQGAERYKAIVDAYADGAAETLRRW